MPLSAARKASLCGRSGGNPVLLHRLVLDARVPEVHVLAATVVVGDVDAIPLAADFVGVNYRIVDRSDGTDSATFNRPTAEITA